MDELFAKIYVDEDISPILSLILRNKGFNTISCHDLNNFGLNDQQQLAIAINLKRALITYNKENFLQDSGALNINHFGIIIVTRQHRNRSSLNRLADEIIKRYLNRYAHDEFINAVFYI